MCLSALLSALPVHFLSIISGRIQVQRVNNSSPVYTASNLTWYTVFSGNSPLSTVWCFLPSSLWWAEIALWQFSFPFSCKLVQLCPTISPKLGAQSEPALKNISTSVADKKQAVCADCELSSPGRPAQRPPAIVLGVCGLHDSCTDVFICLCASHPAGSQQRLKRETGRETCTH